MADTIVRQVTIASGAATSTPFPLNGYRIAGVIGATAWTAADISFEVRDPSGAWRKVVDNAGALVKITGVATAASEFMIPPEIADRITGQEARVVSTNTASEADVNQGADRVLYVVLAPLQT